MTSETPTRTIPRLRPAAPSDRPAVESLLSRANLPLEGLAAAFGTFIVALEGDRTTGAIGLELHGDDALLRSAVVAPETRGTGVGTALVEAVIAQARCRGLRRLFLLTTTAERYFARFGFRVIDRDRVPESIRRSPEFAGACPSSATAMALDLDEAAR